MKKILQKFEEKVKTKEDLLFYLEKIDSAKESVFKDSPERGQNEVVLLIEKALQESENKKETLTEKKRNLKKKKKALAEREEKLSDHKREIAELLKKIDSTDKKRRLRRKMKDVEKRRRDVEEEIWDLEDRLSELENKIKNQDSQKETSKKFHGIEEKRALLEEIEKHLLSIPRIKMKLAFSPPEETIDRIIGWFEKNYGKKVILDLKTNPRIVGGAVLEYGGKWIDLSLEKKLNSVDFNIPESSTYHEE